MRRLMPLLIAGVLILINPSANCELNYPDKYVRREKIIGRLVKFEQGDYLHAIIRMSAGREESFFAGDEACFLVRNKDKGLAIDYSVVQRYFPEGAGYYPALVIQRVKTVDGQNKWDISDKQEKESIRCDEALQKLTR